MLGLIVCSAVLMANPPESYAEARVSAGRSPADQVRLALWCESHGLVAERLHHLTLAVLADPSCPPARGLMGLVARDGRWLRPETIADRFKPEPALIEYERRRLATPDTADGHSELGDWADEHGLKDQAKAHLTSVTRLDPSREDAWKRLGYTKHGHRWATNTQIEAEKAEIEAQKQADKKWKPVLEKYRLMLISSLSKRDEAEAALAEVTDARAIPSIGRVFAATEILQPRAVRMLGQIDAPASTKALAYLAVFARSGPARRAATETLRGRDPREFADLLIAMLGDPIRFEVKHVDGPDSPGEVLIEGKKVNIRRLYTPPSAFHSGDQLGRDESGRAVVLRQVGPTSAHILVGSNADQIPSNFGGLNAAEIRQVLPIMEQSLAFNPIRPNTGFYFQFSEQAKIPLGQVLLEGQKSAVATERQLREDVRMIEDHNVNVRISNDQVAGVLNDATRQSLPADRGAWTTWWVNQIGYASPSDEWTSKHSVIENVAINYQPPIMPDGAQRQVLDYGRHSCFGAGTPVQTIAGPRSIEKLQVGDRVLTQDSATGALGYKPVLVVHRNPPNATLRIKLQGQPIVASHFHRFWVAGHGWVMARDLKTGDPIRTLGGVAAVESIEADAVQPVYNLDVADTADFYAGFAAALVHDNTLPDSRLVPFDALNIAR